MFIFKIYLGVINIINTHLKTVLVLFWCMRLVVCAATDYLI